MMWILQDWPVFGPRIDVYVFSEVIFVVGQRGEVKCYVFYEFLIILFANNTSFFENWMQSWLNKGSDSMDNLDILLWRLTTLCTFSRVGPFLGNQVFFFKRLIHFSWCPLSYLSDFYCQFVNAILWCCRSDKIWKCNSQHLLYHSSPNFYFFLWFSVVYFRYMEGEIFSKNISVHQDSSHLGGLSLFHRALTLLLWCFRAATDNDS